MNNQTEELNNQTMLPAQDIPEIVPDDGHPENLSQFVPDQNSDLHGLPESYPTTMTNNFYSPEEFREKFAGLLEFLENPATANDCAMELLVNGRNLTSDKIYDLANRHSWLNWIIDRQTQVFADFIQISAFLAVESNVIIRNWTGINMLEKGKIWVNNKIREKQAQAKTKRKTLFGWLSSAPAEAEKPTAQNN